MARGLMITRSRLTRILDGLETKKYIVRKADSNDGRVLRIVPTSLGQKCAAEARLPQNTEWQNFFESLTKDQRDSLGNSIQLLIDNLKLPNE
jgi:DNA-binding MarR family transcriptional regulator